MNKTIIAVYGGQNEGKSETIKNVCRLILDNFPIAVPSTPKELIDYTTDILIVIKIGSIKIGIESQGDPNSRMFWDNTIEKLADDNLDPQLGSCDIILCATRTRGETMTKVREIAQKYSYYTIWRSSYQTDLNTTVINRIAAEDILNIIKSLIVCEL